MLFKLSNVNSNLALKIIFENFVNAKRVKVYDSF